MVIPYLTLPSLWIQITPSQINIWGVEVLLWVFLVATKDFMVAVRLAWVTVRAAGFFSASFLQLQLVAIFFLLNLNISVSLRWLYFICACMSVKSFGILLLFLYHHVCTLLIQMAFLVLLSYASVWIFCIASHLRQTQCLSACFDDNSIVKLGMVFMLATLKNPVLGLIESLHMNDGWRQWHGFSETAGNSVWEVGSAAEECLCSVYFLGDLKRRTCKTDLFICAYCLL